MDPISSPTADAVIACSFPVWYPAFERVAIKSTVIPLSDDFIAYLRSGGPVFLPPPPPDMLGLLDGNDPRFERAASRDVEWDIGDETDARTAELVE